MTDHDVPVVILGAGSTGATLALLLARRGIPSTVLERRRTPLTHPAAHVINARSLEIWREADPDLAAEVAAHSPPLHEVNLIRWSSGPGVPPLGEIDLLSRPDQLDRVRSHSDFLLSHVGQHILMPILWRHLESEPLVDLRLGTSVTGFETRDDAITVHCADESFTGRFLVGADGANSPTREHLGITMSGPVLARMGSVFFRSPDLHPAERPLLTWIYRPEFAGVLIAHADDHYVLMGTYLHAAQAIAADSDAYWRRTLPIVLGDATTEVVATGTWTMTSQTASAFRDGRVLLAGDAAHRFPHTGGYGLNSGVQDAHNLAWKLGAVLTEGADDAILDTYEAERRPVVERFADHSVTNHFLLDQVTRHFGATNRALTWATAAMSARPLRWLPPALGAALADRVVAAGLARTALLDGTSTRSRRARTRAAAAIPDQLPHFISSGLEFGYRQGGPLVADPSPAAGPADVVEYVPAALVGGRLPHLAVVGGGATSLLQMVDTDPSTITLVTSVPDEWSTRLAQRIPAALRLTVVDLTSACADPVRADRILGTARGGAVAVRCDGHIVWCTENGADEEAESLVSFLAGRWAPLFDGGTRRRDRRPEGIPSDHQRS